MQAIRKARSEGKLVIYDAVLAELCPVLNSMKEVENLLSDWQIEFSPLLKESALLAGTMNKNYLERRGSAKRVLPDFLIAAHASLQADRLLARDRGYYRDYFSEYRPRRGLKSDSNPLTLISQIAAICSPSSPFGNPFCLNQST